MSAPPPYSYNDPSKQNVGWAPQPSPYPTDPNMAYPSQPYPPAAGYPAQPAYPTQPGYPVQQGYPAQQGFPGAGQMAGIGAFRPAMVSLSILLKENKM